MRITAYTYEADVHCPACAQARHFRCGFKLDWPAHCELAKHGRTTDENQIPYKVLDNEGNPIHPVFATDEHDFTHCGDCHQELT